MKTKTKTHERVDRLATIEPDRFVDIEVSYSKGGANMLAGTQEQRGYWLGMQVVRIENGMRFATMGEGLRLFMEEAPRFSAKRLAELVKTAKDHPRYQQMLTNVLAKVRLVLSR